MSLIRHTSPSRLSLLALLGIVAATLLPAPAHAAPAAPKGISVWTALTSAKITWKASPTATRYKVCLTRSAGEKGCWKTSGALRTLEWRLKDLKPTSGVDYYFTVSAYRGTKSSTSARYRLDLQVGQTFTPEVTETTADSVSLDWKRAYNANKYDVEAVEVSSGRRAALITTSTTSATVTGLNAGTRYRFRTLPYNSDIPGSWSAPITASPEEDAPPVTAPDVPQNVKIWTALTSAKITWDPVDGAEGYRVCLIEHANQSPCWYDSGRITDTELRFNDMVPTDGVDYYVKITAYRGSLSSETDWHRLDLTLGSTFPLELGTRTDNSLTVSWKRTYNANKYEVVTTEAATGTEVSRRTVSSTSITVTGLKPGTAYSIRYLPYNSDIPGSVSEPLRASTTGSTPPPAEGTPLTIMSYNLCGRDQCVREVDGVKPLYPHFPRWSTRESLVVDLIKSNSPDVFTTQEDPSVISVSGYHLGSKKSSKSIHYKPNKFTLNRSGWIAMPPTAGLPSSRERYAPWVDLTHKTSGDRFIVAGPHIDQPAGKEYDDARRLQVETLLAELETVNTAGVPIIVAGDFNSHRGNGNQSRYPGGYDAPRQILSAAGLVDTVDVAAQRTRIEYNSVNRGGQPEPGTPRVSSGLGYHADHIWVPRDWEVTFWTQFANWNAAGHYIAPYPSDHNPIFARVIMPPR